MDSITVGILSATSMIIVFKLFFVPIIIVKGLTFDVLIYIDWITWEKEYIKTIEETKSIISKKIDNIDGSFVNNFDYFQNNWIKHLNVKKEVKLKNINHMKIPGENIMIKEYKIRKEGIKTKMNEEIKKTLSYYKINNI